MGSCTIAAAKDVTLNNNRGILTYSLVLSTDMQRGVTVDVSRIAATIDTG